MVFKNWSMERLSKKILELSRVASSHGCLLTVTSWLCVHTTVRPRCLLYMEDFKMVPAVCQDEQEGLLGPLAKSAPQDVLRDNRRNPMPAQLCSWNGRFGGKRLKEGMLCLASTQNKGNILP